VPDSNWIGTFTEPITGVTPETIQSQILGKKSVTEPYAGDIIVTITSTTPEPASAAMLGLGGAACLVVGLIRRKRIKA
jgi:hypothetical protein